MSGLVTMRRPTFEALAPRLSTQGFKVLMDMLALAPEQRRTITAPLTSLARRHGNSKVDNPVAAEFLGLLASKLTGDQLPLRVVLFASSGGFPQIFAPPAASDRARTPVQQNIQDRPRSSSKLQGPHIQ